MAGQKDDRLDHLAKAITDMGVIHLKDAARLLGVSEMTIRRDIAAVPGRFGFFGGHIMLTGGDGPYELARASDQQSGPKHDASLHAVRLIRPDETLFIDCGSTMMHLTNLLPSGMPLTIVCYALNIAERLALNPAIRLILLGGVFHPASASFEGQEGLELLSRVGINTAFISAAGLDPLRGATCAHFHEAEIKRKAISLAQRSILVTDSSKLGKVRPAFFAPVSSFEQILTEEGPWSASGE